MRLVSINKGGPGSGFHGHAGRPGLVGGSSSVFILDTFNIESLSEDERIPTDVEMEMFKNGVNILPDDIQKLRPGKERVVLTVKDGRAEAYGMSIYLDEKYLGGFGKEWGNVSKHEYLHTLMANNKKISDTIPLLKFPYYYKHTNRYGDDIWSKNGEQMVMNLTVFDNDRNIWKRNLMDVETYSNRKHTAEEAQSQIDTIDTYFKGLGIW